MSEYAKVSDAVLAFLEKYNSGEFSKIDCNITLHKRDDHILKLEAELAEAKSANRWQVEKIEQWQNETASVNKKLEEAKKTIAELVDCLHEIKLKSWCWTIKESTANIEQPIHDSYYEIACKGLSKHKLKGNE